LLCGVIAFAAGPTTAPTTRPIAHDVNGEERALQMRQVLLDLLDQADQNSGDWPTQLDAAHSHGLQLTYTQPHRIDRGDNSRQASFINGHLGSCTAVVHENFEQNLQGVWIGFIDGHLEFVTTPADLAAAIGQLPILKATIAAHGDPFGAMPAAEEEDKNAFAASQTGSLKLKLLGPDGKTVIGARVGLREWFGDEFKPQDRVFFYDQEKDKPVVSDVEGNVLLSKVSIFGTPSNGYRRLNSAPLVVLHEDRGLIALEELKLEEFDGSPSRAREIHLQPACRIEVGITSVGLADIGVKLGHTEAFAMKPGHNYERAIFSVFNGPKAELWVPPGDYDLFVGSSHCHPAYRYVHIEPGRRELSLQLDLSPRSNPSTLVGSPAPELRNIKGWKNGGPIKLANLHGKYVLLDFWGYWCGPCVGGMPALIDLHDRFKDKGLVIVGVHDDSVDSIEDMNQKLQTARAKFWGGRDLPFLIALDGGGETRIPGTGDFTRGKTTAAYLVYSFPTTLLIGPDGVVISEVKLWEDGAPEKLQKTLEKLLSEPPAK
jgi:thiol-disulfide isomerase/thioredoxin